jgi:hypothetical protein
MVLPVSDARSNPHDQIAHAVETLGRSQARLKVFQAIYRGKKRAKSVNEIADMTGLSRVRVLQEGKRLADNHLVSQLRLAGITAYEKDSFYSANKRKILRLVQDPKAFSQFHTKTRPAQATQIVKLKLPVARPKIRQITVDDIQNFAKVKRLRVRSGTYTPIPEAVFKKGVAHILGDTGQFQDWGGESNDLYTTKVRIGGQRVSAAFAFKGPGKRGILTPGKMGKHGNQIQRLFRVPAVLYVVQYWGQVAEDVVEQLRAFAVAKAAVEGERVFFGVIDGDDSTRLIQAYPAAFMKRGQTK